MSIPVISTRVGVPNLLFQVAVCVATAWRRTRDRGSSSLLPDSPLLSLGPAPKLWRFGDKIWMWQSKRNNGSVYANAIYVLLGRASNPTRYTPSSHSGVSQFARSLLSTYSFPTLPFIQLWKDQKTFLLLFLLFLLLFFERTRDPAKELVIANDAGPGLRGIPSLPLICTVVRTYANHVSSYNLSRCLFRKFLQKYRDPSRQPQLSGFYGAQGWIFRYPDSQNRSTPLFTRCYI